MIFFFTVRKFSPLASHSSLPSQKRQSRCLSSSHIVHRANQMAQYSNYLLLDWSLEFPSSQYSHKTFSLVSPLGTENMSLTALRRTWFVFRVRVPRPCYPWPKICSQAAECIGLVRIFANTLPTDFTTMAQDSKIVNKHILTLIAKGDDANDC